MFIPRWRGGGEFRAPSDRPRNVVLHGYASTQGRTLIGTCPPGRRYLHDGFVHHFLLGAVGGCEVHLCLNPARLKMPNLFPCRKSQWEIPIPAYPRRKSNASHSRYTYLDETRSRYPLENFRTNQGWDCATKNGGLLRLQRWLTMSGSVPTIDRGFARPAPRPYPKDSSLKDVF